MAYYFYMDKMLCPIAPSKLQLKIKGQNKTLTLINEGEINILKKASLTDISFDLLLPNVRYPFATYKSGFKNASHFLDKLESLKSAQTPFQFIVTRTLPNGKMLFNTNMKVSLEDYTIEESSKEGFDVVVSIKLKQYKSYGAKTCKVTYVEEKVKVSTQNEKRETTNAPIGIGSSVVVNGRLYRDSYGNAPGQTRTNYTGKVNFVNLKGSHPYHVTTPDGKWLGWVTPTSIKGV